MWIFALHFTMPMIEPTDYMEFIRKGEEGMQAPILH